MTRARLGAAIIAGSACLSASALAQPAPDRRAAPASQVIGRSVEMHWVSPFAAMSPEGRAIISDAMRRGQPPKNAEQVRRARQRVLDLISADRLDIDAIRAAQAEERRLAIEEHAKAQDRMLRAYQRLSPDDRRAFADGMRQQEERMLEHMQKARERLREMEKRMREDLERMQRETGGLLIVPDGAFPFGPLSPTAPLAPISEPG